MIEAEKELSPPLFYRGVPESHRIKIFAQYQLRNARDLNYCCHHLVLGIHLFSTS